MTQIYHTHFQLITIIHHYYPTHFQPYILFESLQTMECAVTKMQMNVMRMQNSATFHWADK